MINSKNAIVNELFIYGRSIESPMLFLVLIFSSAYSSILTL